MYYFDESGDLGFTKGTKSNYFVISVYKKEETNKNYYSTVRKYLKIKNQIPVVKWNKLDKFQKNDFINKVVAILDKHIFTVIANKEKYNHLQYETVLEKLIKYNNFQGEFFYDGDHLTKSFDILKRKLKIVGVKTSFINSETSDNPEIQYADLFAGYTHSLLMQNKELQTKNIIWF